MNPFLEDVDLSPEYIHFILQIVQDNTVWALYNDDDFIAECPSLYEYDVLGNSRALWCFWATEDAALACQRDEWQDYACVSWCLSDFINDILLPMQDDGHWVGVAFDVELCGMEIEPLAMLCDIVQTIEQQGLDNEFDDWATWQTRCQTWQAQQKRTLH